MAFPVAPVRQRCQSIMWCVIWGILLLMWLIAGIRGLSLANAAGDTTAMGLLLILPISRQEPLTSLPR